MKMAENMVTERKNMQHMLNAGEKSTLIRERSFVQTPQQNKRRSLGFQSTRMVQNESVQNQQMRSKPAIEIYRPPNIRSDGSVHNKLNVNAPEFTINRDLHFGFFAHNAPYIQHSKSSGNIQKQFHLATATTRSNEVQYPIQPILLPNPEKNIIDTPSFGVHVNAAPKVKFCLNQMDEEQPKMMDLNENKNNLLQRSKSMSSADTLVHGIGRINLEYSNEYNEMGKFLPEIKKIFDQALSDPKKLNARSLMVLANQIMQRAVEGRRFALPASRFCIAIIAKEHKETFLEAILNICRQWYQERDKVLGSSQTIKNSARPRFIAFMAYLTEMFCQLKRRQLQLRTKCDGVPPPIVLLTVLSKCCEDCVRPPVRSLSEIECLFYVLTCVGHDIETHLPQQLELLLSMVRDAFLNSNASAPTIRRRLLQLIELQASHWQLAGNTVLYYYPTK